ncbi:hypothetical protein VNO78_34359 [Psophocarpus tetragonolobus]|uniref:Uncharacterized protein n=1 Tax=Psophocarpus tetragonolobus TaxID=3891 RepID=A0AAN9RK94_PSOTE
MRKSRTDMDMSVLVFSVSATHIHTILTKFYCDTFTSLHRTTVPHRVVTLLEFLLLRSRDIFWCLRLPLSRHRAIASLRCTTTSATLSQHATIIQLSN